MPSRVDLLRLIAMLGTLIRNLLKPRHAAVATAPRGHGPLRLHIGGREKHPDWRIVDVIPGEGVDYVRSCTDLAVFGDGTVAEIYASHVIEHLGYQRDLARALKEFHRVLEPGGRLRVSVPDLQTLCELFLDPALDANARFHVMRMMFGGQTDEADFHHVGLTEEFLAEFMRRAGFVGIERVQNFGLFEDASALVFGGRPISLNVTAQKPG